MLVYTIFLFLGDIMDKRTNYGMKIIQCLSGLFLAIALLYFVIGELYSEKESYFKVGGSTSFNKGWEMVEADGTRTPITVPGACGTKSGEVLRIENELLKKLRLMRKMLE